MSSDEWNLFCTRKTRWGGFLSLAHESNSLQDDMPLYLDTFFWLWANQSLLLLLNAAYLAERQLRNSIG